MYSKNCKVAELTIEIWPHCLPLQFGSEGVYVLQYIGRLSATHLRLTFTPLNLNWLGHWNPSMGPESVCWGLKRHRLWLLVSVFKRLPKQNVRKKLTLYGEVVTNSRPYVRNVKKFTLHLHVSECLQRCFTPGKLFITVQLSYCIQVKSCIS